MEKRSYRVLTFMLAFFMILSTFIPWDMAEAAPLSEPEDPNPESQVQSKPEKFVKMPVLKTPLADETEIKGFADEGSKVTVSLNGSKLGEADVKGGKFTFQSDRLKRQPLKIGDEITVFSTGSPKGVLKLGDKYILEKNNEWKIPLPDNKRVPLKGNVGVEITGYSNESSGNPEYKKVTITPYVQGAEKTDAQGENPGHNTIGGHREVVFRSPDGMDVTKIVVTLPDDEEPIVAVQPETGFKSREADYRVISADEISGERVNTATFHGSDIKNGGFYEKQAEKFDSQFADSKNTVRYFELGWRTKSHRTIINRYEKTKLYYQIPEEFDKHFAGLASRGLSAMRPLGSDWKVSKHQEPNEFPGVTSVYSTRLLAKGKTALIGDDDLDGWLIRQGADGKVGTVRFYLKPDTPKEIVDNFRKNGISVRTWVRKGNKIIDEFTRSVVLRDRKLLPEQMVISDVHEFTDEAPGKYAIYPCLTKVDYNDADHTLYTHYKLKVNPKYYLRKPPHTDLYISGDKQLIPLVDSITVKGKNFVPYHLSQAGNDYLIVPNFFHYIGLLKLSDVNLPITLHLNKSLGSVLVENKTDEESFNLNTQLITYNKFEKIKRDIDDMSKFGDLVEDFDKKVDPVLEETLERKHRNLLEPVPLQPPDAEPRPSTNDYYVAMAYAAKYPTEENINWASKLLNKSPRPLLRKNGQKRIDMMRKLGAYLQEVETLHRVKYTYAQTFLKASDHDRDGTLNFIERDLGTNTSPAMYNTDMDVKTKANPYTKHSDKWDSYEVLDGTDPIIHPYEWYDSDDILIHEIKEGDTSLTGKLGNYDYNALVSNRMYPRKVELRKLNVQGDPEVIADCETEEKDNVEGNFTLTWNKGDIKLGDQLAVYVYTPEKVAGKQDLEHDDESFEDYEEGTILQRAYEHPEISETFTVTKKSPRPDQATIDVKDNTLSIVPKEQLTDEDEVILSFKSPGDSGYREVPETGPGPYKIGDLPDGTEVHVEVKQKGCMLSDPLSFIKHEVKVENVEPNDAEITLTPPEDSDPGDEITLNVKGVNYVITKGDSGWKYNNGVLPIDDKGHITVSLNEAVGNDEISITYRQLSNGGTITRITPLEESRIPKDVKQEYSEETGKVVTAIIPHDDKDLEEGAVVRLVDENGEPVLDPKGHEITGTVGPLKDGNYPITIPLTDEQGNDKTEDMKKVFVELKEKGKAPAKSEEGVTLDLMGPEINDPKITTEEGQYFSSISGTTEPGATVVVKVGEKEYPVIVKEDGAISGVIPTPEKGQEVVLIGKDNFGNIKENNPVPEQLGTLLIKADQAYEDEDSIYVEAEKGVNINIKVYNNFEDYTLVGEFNHKMESTNDLVNLIKDGENYSLKANEYIEIRGELNGLKSAPVVMTVKR